MASAPMTLDAGIVTRPAPDPDLVSFIQRPDATLPEIIRGIMSSYSDRPALGWRPVVNGTLSASFRTISYGELWERASATAAALAHHPALRLAAGDAVGTLGFAGVDYVTIDLALATNRLVAVPLPTTANVNQLAEILGELAAPCIAASGENLSLAVGIAEACRAVRSIILFDGGEGVDETAAAAAREALARLPHPVRLLTLAELRVEGASLPPAPSHATAPPAGSLSTIFYTSGSTGTPKGAMYPERLVLPWWQRAPDAWQILIHYQPLNHPYGKSAIAAALAGGGTVYFTARSDLSTLLDDIAATRPTTMMLVPRVCELFYQQFHARHHRDDGPTDDGDAAFADFRLHRLGGRVSQAANGSAPLSPELGIFMKRLLGFEPVDGYGTTETGVIAINGAVQYPPVIEYKLIDVPELGYHTTDTPYPRGELVVKTRQLFAGYFDRPALTASVIDDDGFYHTGDIMAELAPDRIAYLDRRNNVMKLAQGEFVAVARLEALFAGGDPLIRQAYIYGNSSRSYLLGVIVPNEEALAPGLSDQEVKKALMNAVRGIAATSDLQNYEVPRDIIVEHTPFSTDNGLLTGLGKAMRPALKARYGDRLEALYAAHAVQQDQELQALRRDGDRAPVIEAVIRAVRSTLGLSDDTVGEQASFADLGGDSLSAVSFSLLLEDIYGFPVDVGTIMHPTGTLATLARTIEARRAAPDDARPDVAAVHGDPDRLKASDLTLDRFMPAAVLDAAAALAPPIPEEPRVVLLTGANGFLGRFLCLEWLERLDRTGGRLICLARGADDESARARLAAVFASDADLKARFDTLAARRLEVIAGDLGSERLGLVEERWNGLARDVDLIVHAGALVNHRLPYRQVFGPNVAGTGDLIRLALTERRKRIVNISSIAVVLADGVGEDEDIRAAVPEWRLSDRHAEGYSASKWAAEVLLNEAHDRFDLPVTTFRSNMILAHSRYRGQLNVPDMFTRWLLSLALTRLAPQSFYRGDAARAHYDGLPVDFIAAAIVAIGERSRAGRHVFHVLNPHDDGISMDSFADWIGEEGPAIKRVPGYATWAQRFEGALRELPDARRQASLLPLMQAMAQPVAAALTENLAATRFAAALRETDVTADGEIPGLDRKLIAKYLADLRFLELL